MHSGTYAIEQMANAYTIQQYFEKNSHFIVSRKNAVALFWKDTKSPQQHHWHAKLWRFYIMSKITENVDGRNACKSSLDHAMVWFPIVEYLIDQGEIPATVNDLNLWQDVNVFFDLKNVT
ncbi:UNVERIFIED_CONTAM: hypothetical protein K2H54_027639 [Gekko kuhli]